MKSKRMYMVAAALLWMLGMAGVAQADSPDDKDSLSGLKEVKVVFDITTGNAKKLLSRLGLIEETRDTMVKQGVTPHFVLTVRGPASLLMQRDQSRISLDDLPVMEKIQEKIKEMSKDKSYELSQCSVANRYLKIKNEDTISEMRVVGNSWVSLAAYQNKGYAYIPID